MARQITSANNYSDRFLKLIPAELIGAFAAISSAIPENRAESFMISLAVFTILLVLVPFYLRILLKVESKLQIAVSMLSFVVWAFTVGGLSRSFVLWEDYYNSIIITLWAVISPLLDYHAPKNGG